MLFSAFIKHSRLQAQLSETADSDAQSVKHEQHKITETEQGPHPHHGPQPKFLPHMHLNLISLSILYILYLNLISSTFWISAWYRPHPKSQSHLFHILNLSLISSTSWFSVSSLPHPEPQSHLFHILVLNHISSIFWFSVSSLPHPEPQSHLFHILILSLNPLHSGPQSHSSSTSWSSMTYLPYPEPSWLCL